MPKTKTSRTNPFITLLSRVAPRVDTRLAEVGEESERQARLHGREVGAMVAAVRHLCERGGKRLRPGLCAVGALCQDERFDIESCIEAGVSLELLQAYFLIHDDWMDEDTKRRGGPTAHVELGRKFKSEELGEKSAILAGDHAVALAQAHLTTVQTSPTRLRKVFQRFAEMQLAAVAGQQLDLLGAARDPELTYELKTASYTVSGPLLVGAELAGGSPEVLRVLSAYARPAGIAFQLRDDLVGVFGSSRVTGKPQGGDLREGKNTSLVREARTRLTGRALSEFEATLGRRDAAPVKVRSVIRNLEECGAKSAIETRIEVLMAEATGLLSSPHLTPKGRALLRGATTALGQRAS